MNTKLHISKQHLLLKNTLALALFGSIQMNVQAALPVDAVLKFNPSQIECLGGLGTVPNCSYGMAVAGGSYFAMDTNGSGVFEQTERTAMENNEGVRLGDVQPATGSHSGTPDGSESSTIDKPWSFFANTGMTRTTSPVVIVNGDDGTGDNTASLDFSGWGVTWNGISNIPLGGDSVNFGDTGVAILNCSASCENGESFSLDYFAHIAVGDPSGFGGVFYTVHLEGVIGAGTGTPLPPTKSVAIDVTGGNSHECSQEGGSLVQATVNITTADANDIASVNWTLDGEDAGSGNSVDVFTPLGNHTLSVAVDTLASGMFDNSESVTVSDNTAPELSVHFIDRRDGQEITEVSGHGKHRITVSYDVSDICDPEPTANGVAVPVHAINDGDKIVIKNRKLATARLGTSAVNVAATAKDTSGNQRNSQATLLVIE